MPRHVAGRLCSRAPSELDLTYLSFPPGGLTGIGMVHAWTRLSSFLSPSFRERVGMRDMRVCAYQW
jgi:hypothetical protein